MTSFPGSPRLMKGAIIGIDPTNPVASIIPFQYNPETLTRTLKAKMSGGGNNPSEVLRLSGAPVETIKLDLEIDATDALERADPLVVARGIYPQLSALEMLIYPKTATVIKNTALLLSGSIEIISPVAPLTVLVWGPSRVLPVMITDFSITEEAYDVNLNPQRAKVSLGLKVLSYNDLPTDNPGYFLFLAHQIIKETMATLGSAGSLADIGGGMIKLV
jgi:hypothetical protein